MIDRAVASVIPLLPRSLVGAVAKRYISGETLESALDVTARFNQQQITTTMDILGEHVSALSESEAIVKGYLEVLAALQERELDGNISVKLTHLGLKLDLEAATQNVRRLVADANERNNSVRIDMEDSSTTTQTLDIYRRLRAEGLSNVGVVLQAYLHRSLADAKELAGLGARIRVCKGIYRESPSIAYQDGAEINRSYLQLVEHLLDQGCHVAIATHDESLVEACYRLLEMSGAASDAYEFQMLLGVTEKLRDSIVAAGHPLRVYVPYGPEWYAYSIRRLRENPKIAGYVFRAMFGG